MNTRAAARRLALLVIGSVWITGLASASQDIDARADRLASLQREFVLSETSERRREIARTIQDLRDDLIREAPDDPRAPTWLLDEAAATIDRVDLNGALPAVRFGVPTAAQRRAVELAARDAHRHLVEARQRIDASIERLETELLAGVDDPNAPSDAARLGAIERDLARLIDREQLSRLPYYMGLTASMRVLVEQDDAAQQSHAKLVAASLGDLDLPPGEALARGRVAIGSTILALGDDEPPALSTAHEWFERARDASSSGTSTVRIDTILGLASVLSRRPGVTPDAVWAAAHTIISPVPDDPRLALRASEGVAVSIVRVANNDAGWLGEAIRPILSLPERTPSGERLAWEHLVYQKIALLSAPTWPFELLPAEVAYARAIAESTNGLIAGTAESDRLLRSVADRPDAGRFAPKAMWELAARQADSEDPAVLIDTIGLLDRLVRSAPASPEAANAAGAAPVVGRYAYEASLGTTHAPDAERAYLIALRLGAFATPATDDAVRWRASLALLISERPGLVPDPDARLDELLRAMEAIPANAPETRALHGVLRRAIDSRSEPIDAVTATRAYDWARTRSDPDEPYLRFVTAGALLEVDPALALRLLVPMVTEEPTPDDIDVDRASALLGIAQRRTGSRDDAFGTLRELTASLERRSITGPTYWMAWAELLEMLAEDNDDGSRSPTIRLQVRRLRVLDASLGGPPSRARIEAVARGLHGV